MRGKWGLAIVCFAVSGWGWWFNKIQAAEVGHLVISEIQVGGTRANDEFVEIYNPMSEEVDLTGLRLAKKTATETNTSNLVASMSGMLGSKKYYLITHKDSAASESADLQYSTTAALTANNTVFLQKKTNGEWNTIDKVGMGNANDFETQTAIMPSPGRSVQRKNISGEIQDTDDNLNDFEEGIPNPQNSSWSEPTATATPEPTTATPTETVNPTLTPTPEPIPTVLPTPTAAEPTPTLIPTLLPTPTAAEPTITISPTVKPNPEPKIQNHYWKHWVCEYKVFRIKWRKGYKEIRFPICNWRWQWLDLRFYPLHNHH